MGRYFVGLLLPDDIADLVDGWRQRFDPELAEQCPPHITVAAPFEAEDDGELVAKVRQLLPAYPQCFMRSLGLGVFWGTPNILHLKIDSNACLEELHRSLIEVIGGKDEWEYNPHITLAHLNRRQLDEAILFFAHTEAHFYLDFYFICRKLVLFKKLSSGKWVVVQNSRS
ncbi:hypothetical protein A2797_01220 [candidate division WWE3 bacterium RIFCSPHIGHO2_01_FULL_48_15]|uniref:2'-5' RNA ligase n=1 Tax=candidate division WWE3 bacterium RIFCSPHIGHO2_01_FULL_48_15 TaxID=1802619 RepID=A0A1F4VGV9_UNCKA|nr:MAG: hypothetical protein A2797_01220 [candidate division WWE3 bacterium RIFCSPHIGHO2_01_FULL_48_15]